MAEQEQRKILNGKIKLGRISGYGICGCSNEHFVFHFGMCVRGESVYDNGCIL